MPLFDFTWKCPDCGCVNTADAIEAYYYSETCGQCEGEFEIYFDAHVLVTDIKKV